MTNNTIPDIPSMREQVSPEEWQIRVDLAAAYRLVAMFGWDDLVFTHVSARVPGEGGDGDGDGDHAFLINPYGLFFEEITASSLIKVDAEGRPLMDSPFPVNPAGFVIHSAVHEARHEVGCVMHTHTVAGVAVSAQEDGLLPISQQACFPLSSIAYHGYEGLALRDAEKRRLVDDLGTANHLILRNHGLLTCGRSVADAVLSMYRLQRACEVQIAAQAGGRLTLVSQDIIDGMPAQGLEVSKGLGSRLMWPGLLRRLDRHSPGYAV
ncbi:MAG: class II aldolase/adducin family protein [Ideonella sp.]